MATYRRTLTREQRDLLWQEAVYDCEPDGDFDQGREVLLEAAQTIRDTVRLYDDLGWNEQDGREVYTLTMPDDQLERILGRLTKDACELIQYGLDGPFPKHDPNYLRRNIGFLHTCLAVEGKVAS